MTPGEANTVLHSMVKSGAIDAEIVNLLERNIEDVNGMRHIAQMESGKMYEDIIGPREK
jgi:hypothetical protein